MIQILASLILFFDVFPYGASDEDTYWSPDWSWTEQLTINAPAGVYVVEHTYNVDGYHPNTSPPVGGHGMPWRELNNSPNIVADGVPSPRGYYTNKTDGTFTIQFPVPAWDQQYFRVRQIQ